MTGEVRRGTCGLVAINTILGWVLSGPIRDNHPIESFVNLTSVHTLHINTVPSLDTQLAQFWELESLGIPNQELSAQTRFESFVSFDGQRYKVRLPWKKGHPPLSNNLSISEKRLSSLLHKLHCSPSLFTEYDTIIQEQLKQGTSQPLMEPRFTTCHTMQLYIKTNPPQRFMSCLTPPLRLRIQCH